MAAPAAPLFGVGDTVYFKESAQQGFLEAVRISHVTMSTNEQWTYNVVFGTKLPDPPVFGDRITHQNPSSLYFNESELITFCEAAELVEQFLEARLAEIRQQRAARC